MTKKNNVYNAEFKVEAVRMTENQGFTKTAVDLGISPISLRNWSKKLRLDESLKPTSLNDALK